MMDIWESSFRGKSARRSRYLSREAMMKQGILLAIFGSIAAAIYLNAVVGLPF